jgi:transcriptional regulator with GAF, ATPase, and Fis domain
LVLLYAPSFQQFSPAYLLEERDLVIGRDPSAHLCIPEAAVSRMHARVHFRDGSWMVTDLGGRNGTIVDGEFVQEMPLEHLHEIRIGDAIFKFVQAGAESYARYRIDGMVLGEPEEATVDTSSVRMPTSDGPWRSSNTLVGGYQIDRIARALKRVAKSGIAVILLGESGTGKEVFARELHAWSGRRGPFQAINCAAIPAPLLESELFGYKRGAFSGADRDKIGLFRAADGGTLFLDEIGDMPMEAQAKLLRVLQSKEVFPVGATQPERIDVRVVCATHRDLNRLQREGRFRGDLYARLNEYSVVLPPLRERKEDIYALCRALLLRHGRPDLTLAFPFMTGLLHYDFPFNVRELEGLIKRGIALAEGPELVAAQLPDEVKEAMRTYGQKKQAAPWPTPPHAFSPTIPASGFAPPGAAPTSRSPLELAGASSVRLPRGGMPTEQELRTMLVHHRGNVAAVGREFGRERMQVHRWMRRYGIDADEYR